MSTQLHTRISNEIVASLEQGNVPPWRCPWATSGPPANAVTGRRYTGINVWLVQLHRQRLGLSSNIYATFSQWDSVGCRVKARPSGIPSGRWGCNLVYCKPVKKPKATAEDDEEKEEYLLLKSFKVFNTEQVEGEFADRLRAEDANEDKPFLDFTQADRIIAATGADIRHGGDRAFYMRPVASGDGDYIQLPDKIRFVAERDYYQTAFHELAGHWTEHRLGWVGGYAEAELRAELAACCTMADLGFPPGDREDSTAYIGHWLRSMREDARYIFRVTADASRAASFVLSFSCPQREESEEAVLS